MTELGKCRGRLMSGIAICIASAALPAYAQVVPGQGVQGDIENNDEIVVTATRRSESIQKVPVTITAISNEKIQNLEIKNFTDIQALSPGLSFEQRGSQGTVTSMRGISSTVTTSAPAAVVIYLDEVPVNDLVAFRSIYDIGQIEVLRGPQGTLRGVAAPVGSITLNTRRPDLNQIGGTGSVTYTDQSGFNAQAALNLPIIQDTLAIRLAGLYDRNENGNVRNPITGAETDSKTRSLRASLVFQPIEALNVFASYQYLRSDTDSLALVEGAGLGYNGPVIASGRRGFAVQERVKPDKFTSHAARLNAKLDISNEAVLSYIGGYTQFKSLTNLDQGDTDTGNAIVNFSAPQLFFVDTETWSHELRLDSVGENRFWDYSFGVFYQKNKPKHVTNVGANSGATNLLGLNPPTGPADLLGNSILLPETRVEKSIFASSTFHLPTGTDITLGARRLYFKRDQGFILTQTTNGVPNTPFPIINEQSDRKFTEWVYDAKIVQHLTDDKMVYFSYGHGFRGPGANRGVPLPLIDAIQTLPAEKTDSYELGFKGDFLDRRVQLSAAIFQQDFKGFNSVAGDVPFCPFYAAPGPLCSFLSTSGQVVFAGNARVRGFEADLFARLTDNWNIQGSVSYAKGSFKNAQVPYRPDLNGDGVPDTNIQFGSLATQPLYFRSSSGPISEVPKWNFTLQSEYTHPIGDNMDIYIRSLFTYKGKRSEVSSSNKYDAEKVLNLYAGIKNVINGLDLTVFAKNIFNDRERIYNSAPISFGNFPTGYREVRYTPSREFGITVRYSFGGG